MFFSASRFFIPAARQDSSQAATRDVKPSSLLRRVGLAIWHGLEDIGQARAHREMRLMADCWAVSDPEMARQLRAASSFDCTARGQTTSASSQPLAAPAGAAQVTS